MDERSSSAFLIKLCDRWAQAHVRAQLGGRTMYTLWRPGTELPSTLVNNILSKLAGLAAPEADLSSHRSEPLITLASQRSNLTRGTSILRLPSLRSNLTRGTSMRSDLALSTRSISAGDGAPEYDVFISLRFGEAGSEGQQLKQELERRGVRVFICNELAGANLMDLIYSAIQSAKLVVLMASATYGRRTTAGFSTYEEFQFT